MGYQLALLPAAVAQRSLAATNQQQQQLGFVRAAIELVQVPALDLHDTVVLSRSRVRILILGNFSARANVALALALNDVANRRASGVLPLAFSSTHALAL